MQRLQGSLLPSKSREAHHHRSRSSSSTRSSSSSSSTRMGRPPAKVSCPPQASHRRTRVRGRRRPLLQPPSKRPQPSPPKAAEARAAGSRRAKALRALRQQLPRWAAAVPPRLPPLRRCPQTCCAASWQRCSRPAARRHPCCKWLSSGSPCVWSATGGRAGLGTGCMWPCRLAWQFQAHQWQAAPPLF